jgi:hypothetical protein
MPAIGLRDQLDRDVALFTDRDAASNTSATRSGRSWNHDHVAPHANCLDADRCVQRGLGPAHASTPVRESILPIEFVSYPPLTAPRP